MKRSAFIVLFLSMLVISFCGKSGEKPPLQTPRHEKNDSMPAAQTDAGSALRIRAVAFSPAAPTVLDDVAAVASLADGEAADVGLNYRWFVDGREIVDASGDRLGKARFKKGSWIYCQVQAFSGSEQSAWYKSDVIRVLNSLPALQLEPPGDFRVPGVLQYQAAASDPDNDELTFEVLSPLEQGIAIDPKTGALSWKLTEETVKSLGESIEITIAVSDGEGEKVTGTITLQLTSTKKTQ
jgi:hypothetical protein